MEGKTATSQKIHLGHYKALLVVDGNTSENEDNPAECVWHIVYFALNASIQCGVRQKYGIGSYK